MNTDRRYLSVSGGQLVGTLNMQNNKIIGLADPTRSAGAATKCYVDSKLSQSGMTQFTADNRYLSLNGGGLKGVLNMGHNRIINLPKATDNEDVASVVWVKENTLTPTQVDTKIDEKIPKGLWHLISYVKGSPSSHAVEYRNDNVLNVTYRKVLPDTQLIFSFKNDLPDGYYTYDWDIRKNATPGKGVNIYLLGECGGSGYDCKLIYRYWAANQNSNGREFSVANGDK